MSKEQIAWTMALAEIKENKSAMYDELCKSDNDWIILSAYEDNGDTPKITKFERNKFMELIEKSHINMKHAILSHPGKIVLVACGDTSRFLVGIVSNLTDIKQIVCFKQKQITCAFTQERISQWRDIIKNAANVQALKEFIKNNNIPENDQKDMLYIFELQTDWLDIILKGYELGVVQHVPLTEEKIIPLNEMKQMMTALAKKVKLLLN